MINPGRFLMITMSLILSFYLHSMDRYKIVANTQGKTTILSPIENDPPLFSLGGCASCKRGSARRCSDCQGVDYCSKECENKDQDRHTNDCEKIKQAYRGDLERMDGFFKACLNACKKANEKEYFESANNWHYRILIRLLQDQACCTDKLSKDVVEQVQDEHDQLYKKYNIGKFSAQEEKAYELSAAMWVQERTENDTLVGPEGILKYTMYYFFETLAPTNEKFILKNQWKEKRLKIVEEYKKKLEKNQQ